MKINYENFSGNIFPGFYESLLYNSDTLYNFDYDELPDGYCWEFKRGGWFNYTNEICREWVSEIEENFTNNPLDMKIGKFKSLWSPREYNFTTDKLSFDVSVNLNRLKKYCFKTRRNELVWFLDNHNVIEEEYTVTKTRKVFEEIA